MSVPDVFGLPHLSEDAVAAFADGVLTPTATARARRHCAGCAECAAAVQIQREAVMMLRAAPTPSLPSGLLARLSAVPMSTQLPPPMSGLPTVLDSDGVPVFVAHRSRTRRQAPPHSEADESGLDGPDELGRSEFSTLPAISPPIPASPQPSVGEASAGRHESHSHRNARRVVLPIGLLASAAALVAVGTLAPSSTGANTPITPVPPAANIGVALLRPVATTTDPPSVPRHGVSASTPSATVSGPAPNGLADLRTINASPGLSLSPSAP